MKTQPTGTPPTPKVRAAIANQEAALMQLATRGTGAEAKTAMLLLSGGAVSHE